jgi:hypothetical protein
MSLIEVAEVNLAPVGDALVAHGVDTPAPGQRSDFFGLDVRGWAIGRRSLAEAVVMRDTGRELRRVRVAGERPDVAKQFPDSAAAQASGYFAPIGGLTLAPEFELELDLRLADGTDTRLAVISGRRATLRTAFEPTIQPIGLTALGRTGSTAVTRLLSAHPGIAAYRPFEYEPRVVTYWLDVLTALAEPAAFRRQIAPNGPLGEHWWIGAGEPFPRRLVDEDVQAWLGGDNVEALAGFCQSRIDALYRGVAERFERPGATFFVEKLGADTGALLRELYPGAREIFLVRDFRDVVASIFAFNAKRGFQGFGRDRAASDADYVSDWISESVASFLRAWRTRGRGAHLIRYEELVRRPREVLAGVLEFLELDAPPATVDAMLASLDEPAADVHRTSAAEDSIGRWERDLADDVKDACRQDLGDALAEFGYAP